MNKKDRERQLLGIGLKFLTERPIHDVSLDEVAREAGISRSLLFHYFPTKTAFYEAVVAAAGRRVARNVQADEGVTGREAIVQIVDRYIAQVDRRFEIHMALVHGNLVALGGVETWGSLRAVLTDRVRAALKEADHPTPWPIVHGWLGYVEDLIEQWSPKAPEERLLNRDQLTEHCVEVLFALADLPSSPKSSSPKTT